MNLPCNHQLRLGSHHVALETEFAFTHRSFLREKRLAAIRPAACFGSSITHVRHLPYLDLSCRACPGSYNKTFDEQGRVNLKPCSCSPVEVSHRPNIPENAARVETYFPGRWRRDEVRWFRLDSSARQTLVLSHID